MADILTSHFNGRFVTKNDEHYIETLMGNAEAAAMAFPETGPMNAQNIQERAERAAYHVSRFGYGMALFFLNTGSESLNALCGMAGVFHRDIEDRSVGELGYWVHPNHWSKGVGLEIASGALDWARDHFPSGYPIVASVYEKNKGSIRILEKLGMQQNKTEQRSGFCFLHFSLTL